MNIFIPDPPDEESRYSPTDHEIDKIYSDSESLAYGIYTTLVSYEDHYNNIQNKYKGLTITWVIATIISIGYLISGYEKALNIDSLLIILFLSLLSAQGVFLLWFLDAGVYHKLIVSIWMEIYKIEENYPEVGKSHHLVLELHKNELDPDKFHGIFYASFVFFLLLIGIASLGIYLFMIQKWLVSIIIIIFILLIIGAHYLIKSPPFIGKKKDQ